MPFAEAIPPTLPTAVNFKLGSASFPGDQALGGTTVNVGSNPGDLAGWLIASDADTRYALTAAGAHRGNTYLVPPGVNYTPLVLPVTTGSGWTRIKSNSASLPARGTRITPANEGALFTVYRADTVSLGIVVEIPAGSTGWQFIGAMLYNSAIAPLGSPVSQILHAQGDRLIFERCWIRGNPGNANLARHVRVRGSDFQIWDSLVSGGGRGAYPGQGNAGEHQAIYWATISATTARSHVENCRLEGIGENVMLSDQGETYPAQDVTIRRNHMWKDKVHWQKYLNDDGVTLNPQWDGIAWTVKNLFEIKWAYRVLAEGNIFENNWAQGQDGTALLVSGGGVVDRPNQDITIQHNKIINAYSLGFAQSFNNVFYTYRVKVYNNLGLQIPNRYFFNWTVDDMWFEHNTWVPGDASHPGNNHALLWQGTGVGGKNFPRQTIRRNVFGKSTYGLYVVSSVTGNLTDALVEELTPGGHDFRENYMLGTQSPAVTGFSFAYPSASLAGVSLTDGKLTTNSPLKNVCSDVYPVGHSRAGQQQDAGVDHETLEAVIAGVASTVSAAFSYAQQSGTLIVQFTDTSPTSGITAWDWNFGDATAHSSSQNPTHTYGTTGTFQVTLTITTSSGLGSLTQSVFVSGLPAASFTAVQTPGTRTVEFTDTSTGIPTTWLWTFGDGFTSTSQNPSHDYAATGSYTVTLQVANASGSNQTNQTVAVTYGGFVLRQTPTAVTVGAGVTQIQCTFGGVEVGDLLIAFVNRCDAPSITGCIDSLGHTYTAWGAAVAPNGTGTSLSRAFYTVATAAGSNVVVTIALGGATTGFGRMLLASYQPLGTAQILSSPAQATGTGASPMASGAVSSIGSTRVLHLGYCDYSTTVPTLPSGFTERVMSGRNFVADSLNVTGSSYNYQPTYTGTQDWLTMLASFRAVAPASTLAANFTWLQTANTLTVQFTDTSVGGPIGWIWTGPDGFSSTARNPSFTFTSSGIKAVQLTVTDGSTQSTSTINVPVSGSLNLTAVALTWTGQDLTLATGTSRRSLLYDSFNR